MFNVETLITALPIFIFLVVGAAVGIKWGWKKLTH